MPTNWLEFLYDALGAKFGIVIQSNDTDKAKAALYRAIEKQNDPQLKTLTIRTSPQAPRKEIWIMKKGKANGALNTDSAAEGSERNINSSNDPNRGSKT